MLLKSVLIFAACFLNHNVVSGFRSGAPTGACQNFLPIGHSGRGQAGQNLGYGLSTNVVGFYPGQIVQVSVNQTDYRGIMMQVIDQNSMIVGTFSLPASSNNFRFLTCSSSNPTGTITHTNRNIKTTSDFSWTAPDSCQGSVYLVRAVIVNNFTTYQTGISTSLRCDASLTPTTPDDDDDDDDEGMTTLLPFVNITEVPENKYNTSFEDEMNIYNGWINENWRRQRGRTRSSDTGPNSAEDGSYYIYFEASSPAKLGDTATLRTDRDLRGHFCLCFYVHRNVDIQSIRPNLTVGIVTDNGEEFTENYNEREDEWEKLSIGFWTMEYAEVRITYTRGDHWKGDIAIDNIRIDPGECEEEEDTDDEDDSDSDSETDIN